MAASADWWTTFFRSPWQENQLRSVDIGATAAEVDFLQRVLGVRLGMSVLDVPCGEGRHSRELAKPGYRVTGVDFNATVIEEARRLAAETGESVSFVVGDMRELDFSAEFDGAFCFFGSFGFFDEAGDRAMVEGVHRALKPSARFLVEGHVLESLLPIYRERDWHWVEGEGGRKERMLQDRRFDLETSRVEAEWTWIHDGKEVTPSPTSADNLRRVDEGGSSFFDEARSGSTLRRRTTGDHGRAAWVPFALAAWRLLSCLG